MKWRKFKETFEVDKSKLGLNYEKLLSLLTKHTFPPRSGQVQISDLSYFCQKKLLYSLELKKSKLGIKYEKLLTTKNFSHLEMDKSNGFLAVVFDQLVISSTLYWYHHALWEEYIENYA